MNIIQTWSKESKMEESKKTGYDMLSWHWRNESAQGTFDKYQIDNLFQLIRDLKDENTQLNDDVDHYEKKIKEMSETIDKLNKKIHDMEVKYNQLWHEA